MADVHSHSLGNGGHSAFDDAVAFRMIGRGENLVDAAYFVNGEYELIPKVGATVC